MSKILLATLNLVCLIFGLPLNNEINTNQSAIMNTSKHKIADQEHNQFLVNSCDGKIYIEPHIH
jgi:hypothetical protein